MKILILILISMFLFVCKNSYAITIYKYHDSIKPVCANLATGYYLNLDTHYEIGFGEDNQLISSGVFVLSTGEFLDWAKANGGTEQTANELLFKIETLSHKKTDGKVLINKNDVLVNAFRKSVDLFHDPDGILSPNDYQIRLLSQMVAILMAYNGVISYSDIGITSIIDRNSADQYIINTLLPLWLSSNQIKAEAEQFIKDNDLK